MDIYAEIDQRRAERQARRQARRELEERMNAVMRPIVFASELVIWAVLTYAMLFVGCLWASM